MFRFDRNASYSPGHRLHEFVARSDVRRPAHASAPFLVAPSSRRLGFALVFARLKCRRHYVENDLHCFAQCLTEATLRQRRLRPRLRTPHLRHHAQSCLHVTAVDPHACRIQVACTRPCVVPRRRAYHLVARRPQVSTKPHAMPTLRRLLHAFIRLRALVEHSFLPRLCHAVPTLPHVGSRSRRTRGWRSCLRRVVSREVSARVRQRLARHRRQLTRDTQVLIHIRLLVQRQLHRLVPTFIRVHARHQHHAKRALHPDHALRQLLLAARRAALGRLLQSCPPRVIVHAQAHQPRCHRHQLVPRLRQPLFIDHSRIGRPALVQRINRRAQHDHSSLRQFALRPRHARVTRPRAFLRRRRHIPQHRRSRPHVRLPAARRHFVERHFRLHPQPSPLRRVQPEQAPVRPSRLRSESSFRRRRRRASASPRRCRRNCSCLRSVIVVVVVVVTKRHLRALCRDGLSAFLVVVVILIHAPGHLGARSLDLLLLSLPHLRCDLRFQLLHLRHFCRQQFVFISASVPRAAALCRPVTVSVRCCFARRRVDRVPSPRVPAAVRRAAPFVASPFRLACFHCLLPYRLVPVLRVLASESLC